MADGSMTASFLKSCFSCGEDPSQVQEGRFVTLNCFKVLSFTQAAKFYCGEDHDCSLFLTHVCYIIVVSRIWCIDL